LGGGGGHGNLVNHEKHEIHEREDGLASIVIPNPRNEGVAVQLDGLLRRYALRNHKRG